MILIVGCTSNETETADQMETAPQGVTLNVKAPELMKVPTRVEVKSDTDWAGKVHNKEIEVIEVINILLPVKEYLVEGFKQYDSKFSEFLHEEWGDTQVQLTQALTDYGVCTEKKAAGKIDKKLFLDLEGVWQTLVKTGVAGLRTKSMMDTELAKL
ncbi:MAG: hypothetical protein HOK84_06680 [Bacteroidetes bacterium]|nr:hypothetical protein [Bacteroidota bacterium]